MAFSELRQALYDLAKSDPALNSRATAVFLQHSDVKIFLLQALEERAEPLGKLALFSAALRVREALMLLLELSVDRSLNEVVRAQIVCAIAEIVDGQDAFDERVMQVLRQLESDPLPLVRRFLVKCYGRIAGIVGIEGLKALVNDRDASVREGALQTLSALTPAQELNAKTAAELIDATGSMDSDLRVNALKTLANRLSGSEQDLIDRLLPLTKNQDPATQAAALLCLGRIADAQGKSLQPIIMGLLSEEQIIRDAAAIALSEGFRAEHAHLLKFLVDIYENRRLQDTSKQALLIAFSRAPIGDRALRSRICNLVARDLGSKVPNIRKTAIVVLEGLYDDDLLVSVDVARQIADLLLDKNEEIQIVSASFLARRIPKGFRLTAQQVRPLLLKNIGPVSYLVIDALHRTGTLEAKKFVEEVLHGLDHSLRLYAMKAIGEWDLGITKE